MRFAEALMLVALVLVYAFVFSIVVGCLAAMAGQRYERRKWEKRLLERAVLLNASAPSGRAEVERLETAIDAIAIELERLGEGQRFVTRLLAGAQNARRTPPSPIPGAVSSVRSPTA